MAAKHDNLIELLESHDEATGSHDDKEGSSNEIGKNNNREKVDKHNENHKAEKKRSHDIFPKREVESEVEKVRRNEEIDVKGSNKDKIAGSDVKTVGGNKDENALNYKEKSANKKKLGSAVEKTGNEDENEKARNNDKIPIRDVVIGRVHERRAGSDDEKAGNYDKISEYALKRDRNNYIDAESDFETSGSHDEISEKNVKQGRNNDIDEGSDVEESGSNDNISENDVKKDRTNYIDDSSDVEEPGNNHYSLKSNDTRTRNGDVKAGTHNQDLAYQEEVEEMGVLHIRSDFTDYIPIKVGRSLWGPHGFLLAFKQGLAKLGTPVSVTQLRAQCIEFASNNPPVWFLKSLVCNEYFEHLGTQDDIDSYICGMEDQEAQPHREGRILCHLYNIKLYMLHPHLNSYYLTVVVDEDGTRYNNNIDLNNPKSIYIVDWEGECYQSVSIDSLRYTTQEHSRATSNNYSLDQTVQLSQANECNVIVTKLQELRHAIIEGNIDRVKNIDRFLHKNALLDKLLSDRVDASAKCISKNYLIVLSCMYKQADILFYLLHKTNLLYYLDNEKIDDELENVERLEAFRYAMYSDNFYLVEILYDYWCSSMHRSRSSCDSNNDAIRDLKGLGRLLIEANNECEDNLVRNQQMYVDIHCLIKFNAYQIDLYTELRDLRSKFDYSDESKEAETERTQMLIINILSIHEKHSDINTIRMIKCMPDEEQSVQDLLPDETSLYIKSLLYIMYEVYFRKLDFNVSLFLLDNLHILKKRLETPEQSYQKIECALYHYIYRISEDWRLYLPKHRYAITTNMVGFYKGINNLVKAIHDPHKIYNGPVLFLEQRNFRKSLCEFKKVLECINIKNKIRNEDIPNDEINCLTLLPYMRDDYSLKRIVNYMKAIVSVNIEQDGPFGFLIIERVIQVIGEMFKTSDQSLHLSKTTKSLLQTVVSVDTLKKLETLRTILSHAEDGQLTRKIDIENTRSDLFQQVKAELENIMYRIDTVLEIYKPVLDRSIIEKGIDLLYERLNELPSKAQIHVESISYIFESSNIYNQQIFHILEKDFITNTWSRLGFSRQLLREIGLIKINIEQLAIKKRLIKSRITCIILGTLPKYSKMVENKLKTIKDNNEVWNSIKCELPQFDNLMDHPTHNEIEKVTNTLRRLKKKGQPIDDNVLKKILSIKDYNNEWESIKKVLHFLLDEIQIFESNPYEIKKSRCSAQFNCLIRNSSPNDEAITNVYKFIELIKYEVTRLLKKYAPETIPQSLESHEFKGIDELIKWLEMEKCDNKRHGTDNKKNKRSLLFKGLNERIDLLKKAMDHPKQIPLRHHLLRYECDQKLRIIIEMLLADIMSVFTACNIKNVLSKSSNLMTEINLRNVLDHGNPFLEVIGEALDSQDFPTELLTWARSIIEDSESIDALHSLFRENINYEAIKNDSRENMTTQQQKWLEIFKKCSKWQEYLKLIPESRRVYSENTNTPPLNQATEPSKANEESLVKLIAAVQNKEIDNVFLLINEANMDLVDRHGKAALHYAAMKGHVDILQVLLQKGAKANVADRTNGMRPLHYAARRGIVETVTVLLEYGADATIADNHNKLPFYYVNKNNNELAAQLTPQI